MKKVVAGILAHVDAGKTTLSEALLYHAGAIRRLGRVDHRDSFFDTDDRERARGITIFSKEARLSHGDTTVILLDTPGHVDFSAAAERTLQVLDYAILVVSGSSGVQNHTETLWELLKRYRVPTFIFVNKTDLPDVTEEGVMAQLKKRLSPQCVSFSPERGTEERDEELAVLDEELLETYMETGMVAEDAVIDLIQHREVFPCFFGSALKMRGVDEFLEAFCRLTKPLFAKESFGARVYKITRDEKGTRLTHMKITGGSLGVRTPIAYRSRGTGAELVEKVGQIRFYSGEKFTSEEAASAGDVCAVAGLSETYAGQGLGVESDALPPALEPVLSCRAVLPPDVDPRLLLPKLRQLEEEDPMLRIVFQERLREITIHLMGEVQMETLESVIRDRFGVEIRFDDGEVLYKETVSAPVEGVGHFEPLRHYAEVHLLIEPLPRGSGLEFAVRCRESELGLSWQRLVLTHLAEKTHLGVLTGSPLTDAKITLLTGRAHVKHTEGGDFREATYRAVRQGLMQAKSLLLEPVYAFRLEVPMENVGRAITDIRTMGGSFSAPTEEDGVSVLTGRAPVATMRNYMTEVTSYTRGKGRLSVTPDGYELAHNPEEVIAKAAYDPEADLLNTPDSVFCARGAGFTVKWDQVVSYMHMDSGWQEATEKTPLKPRLIDRNTDTDLKELDELMDREFGPIRRRVYGERVVYTAPEKKTKNTPARKKLLLVDGYNVIFAWETTKKTAEVDLEKSRELLRDILINYAAFAKQEIVLVFDAYKVKGGTGEKEEYPGVHVVYTKEGESGDAYMEKLIHEIGRNYDVRVVTSDGLIQVSAVSAGVLRMSASEFEEEIRRADQEIAAILEDLARDPLPEFTWPAPHEENET